ncbi:UNVERIFIED_CONTAM: hypothetical protein Sindi_0494700, partial [Sesamum indicum]
ATLTGKQSLTPAPDVLGQSRLPAGVLIEGESGAKLHGVLNCVSGEEGSSSSSIGMHKRKLEAKLDHPPPKQKELLERCCKKKVHSGWNGPRALEVEETFQKLLEDGQP